MENVKEVLRFLQPLWPDDKNQAHALALSITCIVLAGMLPETPEKSSNSGCFLCRYPGKTRHVYSGVMVWTFRNVMYTQTLVYNHQGAGPMPMQIKNREQGWSKAMTKITPKDTKYNPKPKPPIKHHKTSMQPLHTVLAARTVFSPPTAPALASASPGTGLAIARRGPPSGGGALWTFAIGGGGGRSFGGEGRGGAICFFGGFVLGCGFHRVFVVGFEGLFE